MSGIVMVVAVAARVDRPNLLLMEEILPCEVQKTL